MNILVDKALSFARKAHSSVGQLRKYTGEPYINHPIEVMGIVETASYYTNAMLAAALLHDTIEDTPTTREDIEREFGREIALMVHELTDQCSKGNRALRKEAEARRTISPDAQTIKLADLISNTRSIAAHDPGFAKVYLLEKQVILNLMTKGDVGLYQQALCLD